MAEPVNFKQANFVWKGWPGKGDEPGVLDLPSYREGDQTISCWKMTWKERLRVLLTGKTWLFVWGGHPPVYIGGINPWHHQSESDKKEYDDGS